MRYFLIGFTAVGLGPSTTGSIALKCETFPNVAKIRECLEIMSPGRLSGDALIVNSAFEFKNEEDYNSFRSK